MLVNCPRCGFSQPSDQYCAQCGVDMQSFKPKEKPLLNRLMNNATLQIVILFIAAIFVGQYIFHSQEPKSWAQKISHFKGLSKSNKSAKNLTNDADDDNSADDKNSESASTSETTDPARNRDFNTNRSADLAASALAAANNAQAAGAQAGAQDLSAINFKITYAEITSEMLAKWVTDSSNLGLYQNLQDYSAGIIYDFKKRGENYHQKLKATEIKLALGSSNSNLSGVMSEDGLQMLGLVTAIEYKSNENEIIHGTITVTRSSARSNDMYPAEFNLPKGSAFFMIGAIKRTSAASERAKLDMPPFQIYKSPDFMTRKTEFVIILEPDYK